MRLPSALLSLAAAASLVPITTASSTTRNALAALSAVDNATIHTYNHRITALSEFDLSFNIRPQLTRVRLHLQPNHDILADDTQVTHLNPDGSVSREETVDRLSHKVYRGTAWVQTPGPGLGEIQVGWARVTVTKDGKTPVFSGAFSLHHDYHHVQTTSNYLRTKQRDDPGVNPSQDHMVLWRDSDIVPDSPSHHELRRSVDTASCTTDQLAFNAAPEHPVYMAMSKHAEKSYGAMDFARLFKRQIDFTTFGNSANANLLQSIGQTAGCPSTRKVALVGVATDCTYTADFEDEQAARANVIDQMNTASGIWEDSFNISLGLRNLTMMSATCPGTPVKATEWNQPCSPSIDLEARLNMFSAWRGNQRDTNSHWTLLSTCKTATAVGLAWLGQACVSNAITTNGTTGNGRTSNGQETVAGANVAIRAAGSSEWQIIAHETGHTFGAVHDCTSQTCADRNYVNAQQCCPLSADSCDAGERYIMNPSSSRGIRTFSPCSIGNICNALLRNAVNTQCLSDNRGVTTISGQQCGNGIVEPGEDCDCGGESGCTDDPCCDATTCRFTSGSVCDDANEDCCKNCQFAPAATVCRTSTGDCDPAEVCPGNSGSCPADQTKEDGTSCGNNLKCASGQCTSRDQQCKSVMGSYTEGNDTYACDSFSCGISCASPEFGIGVCYSLQQNFLDGTPCGGGGRCDNGRCEGSTLGGEVKSWIDDNKALVIGISASIGALVLLSILTGLVRRLKLRKQQKRMLNHGPPLRPPPGGWPGWHSSPGIPPTQQAHFQTSQQHPGEGEYDRFNGGGNNQWIPPPAPPDHTQGARMRYA